MPTVNVKWSGQRFDNIQLDLTQPAMLFKTQLFSLTGVEPERQKIMVKGGMLKDDADLTTLGIKEGHTFMMMGTPGDKALKPPAEQVKFVEDMSFGEANVAHAVPAGLANMGNTCYANATLQVLRAVPELKQALNNHKASFSQDNANNLTIALRELFKLLDNSGEAVPPLVFLQSLRTVFPQFSQQQQGHFLQQDAEECFSNLVSTLDQKLKVVGSGASAASSSSFVSQYMTGTFATSMKCDEAAQETSVVNQEKFYRLHCHISQNVNMLSQGLKETMSEKIEKNSETLGRTAVYTKTSMISRLPQYLTVGFVRFFWKQEAGVKAKIMRAVKFPFDLELDEFCTPELVQKMRPAKDLLKKQLEAKEEAAKRKKRGGADADKPAEFPKKDTIKDQVDAALWNDIGGNVHGMYELAAVLTHVGRTADAGHYMAWVRSEESADDWWKFDDDKVTAVKAEDVAKLNGGGDWHMAYLLLYRAKQLE